MGTFDLDVGCEAEKSVCLSNIIDTFEQLMQDPKKKKKLSPYMLDILSDLSVLTKSIGEIDNYQPWGETCDEEEVVRMLHFNTLDL